MIFLDRLYILFRWILGVVFITAGGSKLLDPGSFAVLIDAYGLVPGFLVMPIAVCLPAMEAAAGFGLLFDIEGSLSAITVLLVIFIGILGYGIWMGLDVDCGCFGPDDPEAEAFHGLRSALYRDLWMLAGIAFLFVRRRLREIKTVKITWMTKKMPKKWEDANV